MANQNFTAYRGDWNFAVRKDFILNPNVSPVAKLLWIAIRSYCSPDQNTAFPSTATLAASLGISRDTLSVYANELRDLGLMQTEQLKDNGRFSYTLYTLFDTTLLNDKKPSENPASEISATVKNAHSPEISAAENTVDGKLDTKKHHKEESSIKADPDAEAKAVPIPARLDTPEFREEWHGWIEWRRTEKKIKCTPKSAQLMLKKLDREGRSLADTVAAIPYSIASGWTGIFFPKPNERGGRPARPVRPIANPSEKLSGELNF